MSSDRPVKVAFLVLAHAYSFGIEFLHSYVERLDADIYVHIDQKVFEEYSRISSPRVFYIPSRRIFWRGFSMVEATVDLIKFARLNGVYSHYVMISDDTLPLVSADHLKNTLSTAQDLVGIIPRNTGNLRYRYDNFYFFDSPATEIRWTPVLGRIVDRTMLAALNRCERLMVRGKKPIPQYFHGSQWMCVSEATANLLVDTFDNDEWLRESFEFSEVPDEAYFQTIIGSQGVSQFVPITYVDWSGKYPPRIFSDIDSIKQVNVGSYLFVRKVRIDKSIGLEWIKNLNG